MAPRKKRKPAAKARASDALGATLAGGPEDRKAVRRGDHGDPHTYLGPHPATVDGVDGTVVRVFRPDAKGISLLTGEAGGGNPPGAPPKLEMTALGKGLFAAWSKKPVPSYRLGLRLTGAVEHERHDPYRFPPTVSDLDLYLISEGTHLRLWNCLGARPLEMLGVAGIAFAVWAPNARRVSVVGDFCDWDGRVFPMRRLGQSGIFELFLPGLAVGSTYKFEVLAQDGSRLLKADPLAHAAEVPPETASRVFRTTYPWRDDEWMERASDREGLRDVTR